MRPEPGLPVVGSDPVHTGPDPYGHHINLKSLKTSTTLRFVIILQNVIKAYHRKSGKTKYDRKLTELDVETTRIRSRVNGVSIGSNRFLLKFYVKTKNVNIVSHIISEMLKTSEQFLGRDCWTAVYEREI